MKAPSKATANQRKEHNVEKMAYSAFADNTSIVIRFAVVASQICQILRKFELITTYIQGHRSWCHRKVHIQLPRLLVINSNFGRKLSPSVFEILMHLAGKQLIFSTPILV